MNAFQIGAITAAAVLVFPNPAYAQEFTGPRVEATVGWNQVRFDLNDYGLDRTDKKSDIGWGVAAGYDVPLGGKLIGGIEAGVSFSDVDHGIDNGTSLYDLHAKRDIAVSARLGARIGGNALLYGKLGYTNFLLDRDTTTAGIVTSSSKNLDGVRLGAGLEVGLSRNAYLKSEYRYSNYQDGISKNEIVTGVGMRF